MSDNQIDIVELEKLIKLVFVANKITVGLNAEGDCKINIDNHKYRIKRRQKHFYLDSKINDEYYGVTCKDDLYEIIKKFLEVHLNRKAKPLIEPIVASYVRSTRI